MPLLRKCRRPQRPDCEVGQENEALEDERL